MLAPTPREPGEQVQPDNHVRPAEPPYRFENGTPYVPPDEPEERFIPDRGFDAPA